MLGHQAGKRRKRRGEKEREQGEKIEEGGKREERNVTKSPNFFFFFLIFNIL